jgi:hypothetical protein
MVDVPLSPGDTMVTAVLPSVNPGRGAGTLTLKLAVELALPAEAPVTLTV